MIHEGIIDVYRGDHIRKDIVTRPTENSFKPLGLIWIDCPYPVASVGLAQVLSVEARVHVGREPPEGEVPSSAVFCCSEAEGVSESIERIQKANPGILVMVFGLSLDLALARVALKAGARGFIHAGMTPEQIVRAFKVASQGEIVAPRQLLEYLIVTEESVDLDLLSTRQREILELVGEGLTNAQIATRLFLTESTVKQHLRSAYKILGVNNRTEATKLIRNAG